MADSNKLEIQIGADISDLQKNIGDAKKVMSGLANSQKELNAQFQRGEISEEQYANATANLNQKLESQRKIVDRDTQSIQRLNNRQGDLARSTSANATPALQEFSRVIQDAPYGIQGVGNNITQLVSQFGYLSQSTGGARNALTAMIGALAGPAGILFAVSAVVSILTSYGDEIQEFISGTKKAADVTKELNKELEAQKSLLGLLESELNKLNEETKIRVELGELTDEQAFAERQKSLVALLQASIINEEEYQKKSVLLNQQANDARKKDDEESAKKYEELLTKNGQALQKELEKRRGIERDIRLNALRENLRIQNEENEAYEKGLAEREKRLAQHLSIINNAYRNRSGFGDDVSVPDVDLGFVEQMNRVAQLNQQGMDKIVEDTKSGTQEIVSTTQELGTQLSDALASSLGNMATGLGTFIGDALSGIGGGIEQGGLKLLDSLGQLLQDIGSALIQAGIASEAFATLLADFGLPGVGLGTIAIGVGVVAVGKLMSNTAKNAQATLGGGSASTGSSTAPTTQTYSSGNYSSGAMGSGNVVFEIAGTKLVGVLNNTMRKNKSLGGSTNLLYS